MNLQISSNLSDEERACQEFMKGHRNEIVDFNHVNPNSLENNWPNTFFQWRHMVNKDDEDVRDFYWTSQVHIKPNKRARLLKEVANCCWILKCTKEVFHLAVDYFDRYMSMTVDVKDSELNSLVAAALLMAIKYETPKREMSLCLYVLTEIGCTRRAIKEQERKMAMELDFCMGTVTTNAWLVFYLKMGRFDKLKPESYDTLENQSYNNDVYFNLSKLCELFLLDSRSLLFSYRVIAASAVYFYSRSQLAVTVSDLSWNKLKACVEWMKPLYLAIRDAANDAQDGLTPRDDFSSHLQTRVDYKIYKQATKLREKKVEDTVSESKLPLDTAHLWTHPCQAVLRENN